jgi:hypothetical protein
MKQAEVFEVFERPRFTTADWNQYWDWLIDTNVDLAVDPRTPRERLNAYLAVTA